MITDIMLYETYDGGDIKLENGDLVTITGMSNQSFLALFGGNLRAETKPATEVLEDKGDYWGNAILGTESENQYNSKLEAALKTVVLNTAGLSTIEEAAKADMKYLFPYADIEINVALTAPNRVEIAINIIEPDGNSIKNTYIWDGTKNTVINDNTYI